MARSKAQEKIDKDMKKMNEHKHKIKGKESGAETSHPYAEELEKYHGESIEITTILNEKIRGTCICIYKPHLNVVLDDGKDIITIKNVQMIRRNKK